jgi:hypothetical protein
MTNALKRAFKTMGKSLSALALAGSMLMPFTQGCGKSIPAPINNAPTLDILTDQNTPVNTAFSYDTNATDPDLDVITYSKTSGPSWLSINSTNGVISGTPSETDLGSNTSITVKATDEHGLYDEESFNLLVDSQYANQAGKLNYVIVTSNALASNFQALADWKTRKGVLTQIHTIEDIVADSTYTSGRDNAEKLRFFLQDQKSTHPELEYVLLGGDTYRGAYGANTLGGTDSDIPCDLYFSDLDDGTGTYNWNYNWDADADSIFGEIEDNIDLYPDVAIGRAPVNDSAEANTFVNKVLDYEKMTGVADKASYPKKILFHATVKGLTDFADAKDWIKIFNESQRVNPLQVLVDETNFKALYESNKYVSEIATRQKLIDQLNSGYNIVNIDSDGYELDFWAGDVAFSVIDAGSLINPAKSLIIGLTCNGANFTYPQKCIGEELILNPAGGAVGYIGWSKQALGTIAGDGSAWELDAGIFDAHFNKGFYNLGKIVTQARERRIPICKGPPISIDDRWEQYCLNLLGDPEMPIWKNYTGALVPTQIARADCTEINVTDGTSPVSGADVYVIQGANIYSARTGSSGKIILPVTGAIDKVTTVKQNYVPGLIN